MERRQITISMTASVITRYTVNSASYTVAVGLFNNVRACSTYKGQFVQCMFNNVNVCMQCIYKFCSNSVRVLNSGRACSANVIAAVIVSVHVLQFNVHV